jgi:hypothetical protein
MLEGIVYQASLLDPAKGQMPGEQGRTRVAVVDYHQMGNGVVNGALSVLVGLKVGQPFHLYALDKEKAVALQHDLEAEILKLLQSSSASR